jgi:phosphoribosyl-ATP pyrophosphohydrolase/phosphoribosyl-AMP cyclohydrolase/histidinol dehydrogenase
VARGLLIQDSTGLRFAVGGAQAIAALAFGAGSIPPCDLIVGPGTRFVTAAKRLVAGVVGIDMLAGPSELLIIADDSSDPAVIAADLLAQAEHDEDASAILVSFDTKLVGRVQDELVRQLETLPTAATARVALRNGFATIVATGAQAAEIADAVAPEHLQVMTGDASGLAGNLRNYGGLFIGGASAEVFGDYGLGPNHVLPTGGTARYTAGLSVFTFMRARTFLKLDALPAEIIKDTATLARLEGLEGHARAAESRLPR